MPTMTLNLDDRHMDALEALATEQDLSKTALMRQALRLYQMVHQRAKDGQQLAFVDRAGKLVRQVVVGLPAFDDDWAPNPNDDQGAAGVGAGGAPGDGAGVEFCPRSGEHVMGCAEWCATPTGACRACGALAMTAPPFGGRKTRADDEAFQQHQRDRIAEAQRHDAEQAKPKLTDGVARTGDDTEGRSK